MASGTRSIGTRKAERFGRSDGRLGLTQGCTANAGPKLTPSTWHSGGSLLPKRDVCSSTEKLTTSVIEKLTTPDHVC
jgi:hypothetical protein